MLHHPNRRTVIRLTHHIMANRDIMTYQLYHSSDVNCPKLGEFWSTKLLSCPNTDMPILIVCNIVVPASLTLPAKCTCCPLYLLLLTMCNVWNVCHCSILWLWYRGGGNVIHGMLHACPALDTMKSLIVLRVIAKIRVGMLKSYF